MTASPLVLTLLLQAASAAPRSPTPPPRAPEGEEFKVGPEDVLNIHVWQNAELSRSVPVRPDGRISLPLVNDVPVAGLTPTQVRELLLQRYREFDKAVELSVVVEQVNSFRVSVIGKVSRPERYLLRAPTTVLDLLAMAGGPIEYSDPENIVVLRPEVGTSGRRTFRRMRFNYKRVVSTGGESENFALQPNDIVIVP